MTAQTKRGLRWMLVPVVLLALLLTVAPVFAEDELPPEPAATEEPVVLGEPAEAPAAETAEAPAEPPLEEAALEGPAQEEPVVVLPAEEILPEPVAEGELLAEELDMASVESAETLAAPDPYFIAGGITYRFLPVGRCTAQGYWVDGLDVVPNTKCFESGTPISAAVTYIGNNGIVPTDKKIYVESLPSGSYTDTIVIDGADATPSALPGTTYGTYLKQLNGLMGVTLTTTPVLSGTVTISNVIAGFTLDNFVINNTVTFNQNTGPLVVSNVTQTGNLSISNHTGAVTVSSAQISGGLSTNNIAGLLKLNDVRVTNTAGDGINVSNQRGAVDFNLVRADGNKWHGAFLESGTGTFTVKITNSTFNDNNIGSAFTNPGLYIKDFLGTITLDGMSANRNNYYGLYITGSPASVTIKNATFNNNTWANTAFGTGLVIDLTGARPVTLENISAMNNTQNMGIYIVTQGAVTAKNVRAEGNRTFGMYVDNSFGTPQAVTISSSVFSNNTLGASIGLLVYSYGNITLNSVRAEYNSNTGVRLNNCLDSGGGTCTGSGGISITSPAAGGDAAANVFSRNGVYGLDALSRGAISLFNFYADENAGGDGVFLSNDFNNSTAAVTVGANIPNDMFGNVWYNSAYHNYYSGVMIMSKGAVSVSKVNASANTGNNIEIANWNVPDAAPKAVTLSYLYTSGIYSSSPFTYKGIYVETKGSVSAANITAVDHRYYGVEIDTCQYYGTKCLGSGGVTITSVGVPNNFSNNRWSGIRVEARGAITLNNFLAQGNGAAGSYSGVVLINTYANSTGGISMDANLPQPFVNQVNGNTFRGIDAQSRFAILLGRTQVKDHSDGYGANIDNSGAATDQPVTVRFSEFNNNRTVGLYVQSRGQITLTNVSASGTTFSGTGARLYNQSGLGGVTVNTSGTYTNRFNYNGYYGLDIISRGAVALTNVEARENGGINLSIDNDDAPGPRAVTLTNITTSGWSNALGDRISSTGAYIFTLGGLNITNSMFDDHTSSGLDIENNGFAQPVTLNNVSSSRNGYSGIEVYAFGNIMFINVNANNNSGAGAYLDNCRLSGSYCVGTGMVSITAPAPKFTSFSNNGSSGLSIYSGGPVTLTNVKTDYNSTHGTSVYMLYARLINLVDVNVSGAVTVSGAGVTSSFSYNGQGGWGRGLYIQSHGAINVTNADALHNNSYGFSLNNSGAAAAWPVNLTDLNAIGNIDYGVVVDATGAVNLKGVNSSDNNKLDGLIGHDWKVLDNLSHTLGPDTWRFTTTGAYTVNAALNSDYFDAYLVLMDANGSILISNDNGGGGTNAAISGFSLTSAGTYILRVSAVDGKGGPYDLSLGAGTDVRSYNATGVHIYNQYLTTAQAVSITPSARGYGVKANDNFGRGVGIYTHGAVTVSKGWANDNNGYGFYISNYLSPVEAAVILTDVNANDNVYSWASGINIVSAGEVRLTNVAANRNPYGGVYIENFQSTTKKPVLVTNLTVIGNKSYYGGLNISSKGAVSLSGITATSNGQSGSGSGVLVDNCRWNGSSCDSTANVTLTGNNNLFSSNYGRGLYIISNGLVLLNNFSASENASLGVEVDNNYAGALGVQVKRGLAGMNEILANGNSGLSIISKGAVWVEKVKAAENLYNNIFIGVSENALTTIRTVWVERAKIYNYYDGLYVDSKGAILLDGVQARGNDANGIHLNNASALTPQPVTVLRTVSENNRYEGIEINASGDVTLGGIIARANGNNGVHATSVLGKAVVSAAYGDNIVSYNGTNGIGSGSGLHLWNIYSSISVARVIATDNSDTGLYLDNDNTTNPGGAVTVSNVTVLRNRYNGMSIYARGGTISISAATVLDNGWGGDYDGIYIRGYGATLPNVAVLNSRIMGNFGYGLYCRDTNTVTLTGVVNIGNDANGNVSGEDNFYKTP